MQTTVIRPHALAALLALSATALSSGQSASEPADSSAAANSAPTKNTSSDPNSIETLNLNAYVVTASASKDKVTELNASFDTTLVPHSDIVNTTAAGPAGLLDAVPGFFGESAGGEVNSELSVDGLRPDFFGYISLQEDGLPSIYNGFFPEYQLRPDATYERIDVVRNGPSGVFAPEAAAAIVNFITRMPSKPEGDVTVSFTTQTNKRADFFYGGPIANSSWSAMVGGYYELGEGERPVGYNITRGGQFRFGVQKKFEGGSVTAFYKHIDAHTAFYVDVPAIQDADGKLRGVPGFNLKFDTLYGPETQHGVLRPPVGQGEARPLDESTGNWNLADSITIKAEKDLGNGWSVSNGARLLKSRYLANDNRSAGNNALSLATDFLTKQLPVLQNYATTKGLSGGPVVGAQLVQVATGNVITNPAALNGNGLLLDSANFSYHGEFRNLVDDLRFTWQTDRNTLALGFMYLNIDGTSLGETGNDQLIDVRHHARLYDVVGVNAAGQVVDHLTHNGVLQYDSVGAGYYGNGSETVASQNYYVDDEWQVTKDLRIDAGFRYEETHYQTTAEGVDFNQPLPIAAANPTVIAAQTSGSYGNGIYRYGANHGNDYAWSIGANYMITPNLSIYARTTKDFDEGVQDFNVFGGSGLSPTGGNPSRSGFTTLRYEQAGVRYENKWFAESATAFWSIDSNFAQDVTPLNGGAPSKINIREQAKGVDFESVLKPVRNIIVQLSGVVQRSEISNLPSNVTANGVKNGNQIDRLPDVQLRFKPTYFFNVGGQYLKKGRVYGLATYYGQRYGDLANTQKLNAYTNIGAGLSLDISDAMTIDIIGDNLTNALGFTEGNSRGGGNVNAGSGYVLARPIWGRNARIACTLRF